MNRHYFAFLLPMWAAFLLIIGASPVESQPTCDESNGQTERFYYRAVQTQMAYTVYTPPCYASSDAHYPVMYLLHGSTDDDGQWLRLGLAETLDSLILAGEIPPVIAVLPFGNWMANENSFDREGWGQVFMDEVLPRVESEYRVDAQPESRVIGGISRGGFWAYHIALSNPQTFSAVGGHSAFFDEFHAAPEHNPLDLVLDASRTDGLRFYLDRGAQDYADVGLDLMSQRMDSAGVAHNYIIHADGEHNNAYWGQHLEAYLAFYTQDWAIPAAQTQPPQSSIFSTATPSSIFGASTTPTPAAPVAVSGDGAVRLYVPVVVFNSIESHITGDMLQNLVNGAAVPRLVLTDSVVSELGALGVTVSADIRVVRDDALYNTLFRDRALWTVLPFDALDLRYRVMLVDDLHPLDADLAQYPLAFAADNSNFDPTHLTTLTLSGVTALARQTRTAIEANGVEWAAEGILPFVERSDFFHMSNEVSFDPNCPQFSGDELGGPTSFCSNLEHFDLFTLLDVDIMELSGNHNADFGYDAYLETLAWYAANDIPTIGGGETLDSAREPLIIEHNESSIALLSCNWVGPYYALVNEDPQLRGGLRPGAAFCDAAWLESTLSTLANAHDVVVVTVQYTEIDGFVPTETQRFDFRRLADWGADVVVSTASHYPQSIELHAPDSERTAFLHHGLGNLYFDQTFFGGRQFFLDRLIIYDGVLVNVDLYTGIIEDRARPRPMSADERRNFLFLMFNEYGLE